MASALITAHPTALLAGLGSMVLALTAAQSSTAQSPADAEWIAQECAEREQALQSALDSPTDLPALLEACDEFAATLPARDSALLRRGYMECARQLANPELDPAEQDARAKELERQLDEWDVPFAADVVATYTPNLVENQARRVRRRREQLGKALWLAKRALPGCVFF